MNRRLVLAGTGLALSSTLAACVSTDDTDNTDKLTTTSDGSDDESDGHSCPPRGNLAITFVPEVPDDEPILDAEAEQITDVEYLTKALAVASEEYHKLDERKPTESKRLAEFRDEDVANDSSEITSKIGYGETTYVEYENVVYSMVYVEMVC